MTLLDQAALGEARGVKTNSRDHSSREKPPRSVRKRNRMRDRVAMPHVKALGKNAVLQANALERKQLPKNLRGKWC